MKIKATLAAMIAFVILASFCVHEFKFIYPAYFPVTKYDFTKNPLNSSKIELGRNLFFDPILSSDNSISCASCHSPYNAFAHSDHDLSHGIRDQIGTRNAPALFNLAWQTDFMWDGASNDLDEQALAPISHPKEMGDNMNNVVEKLNASGYYRKLFYEAYKDSTVTCEKVLKVLAQFQLTLISGNAKYDQVQQGKATFTLQENNGYQLFLKNCNSCHHEPLFSDYSFKNNGLPVDTTLNDFGRWMVTKKISDSLLFKTPGLRNLSYTYPYMHDGRFNKLSQVINHYTNGIIQYKNLSQELRKPIVFTSNEKVDLITFLLTLNDKDFVFDPKHQYPK